MIYFDNSATTQTRPEVAKLLAEYSTQNFFNPSSMYAPSIKVKNDLKSARARMLKLLGVEENNGRIIFTGSATEANNLVLNGLARKNKKILVSLGEHPSVFEVAKNLANQGFLVDYVKLTKTGTLDIDDLKSKLDDTVGLVSFIHVSNETGAINDIEAISKLIKQTNPSCLVHCDGVQAFGKVKINLANSSVDSYTISGHKIHGPKGVACLYIKNGIVLKPHILGGGQENGLRSGTENAPAIMGLALASEMMYANFEETQANIKNLNDYFRERLNSSGLNFHINSPLDGLKNVLSVSFPGVRGEVLLHCLEEHEIYVSTGSACSSKTIGNRVLSSMGQSNELMLGNIRFSFCYANTLKEVDKVIEVLCQQIPLITH